MVEELVLLLSLSHRFGEVFRVGIIGRFGDHRLLPPVSGASKLHLVSPTAARVFWEMSANGVYLHTLRDMLQQYTLCVTNNVQVTP